MKRIENPNVRKKVKRKKDDDAMIDATIDALLLSVLSMFER